MSAPAPSFNFEQQKKQAKDLLKAVRAGDPSATERLRAAHPRFRPPAALDGVALHDAQLVIARELGFESWPKLIAAYEAYVPPGFFDAVMRGDAEAVRADLRRYPHLIHSRFPHEGWLQGAHRQPTALHLAVSKDHTEVVRALIDAAADVNVTDGSRNAMHLAMEFAGQPTRKILYTQEIRYDVAFALARLKNDILRKLLEEDPGRANANPTGTPPLEWAGWGDNAEGARILFEFGADIARQPGALHVTAETNEPAVLEVLLDHGGDPNYTWRGGESLLHRAASLVMCNTCDGVIELLVRRGADVNKRDDRGRTPLDVAHEAKAALKPGSKRDYDSVIRTLERLGGRRSAELGAAP
jgi:hypothetical protein